MTTHLVGAAQTDVGLKRENNEDSFFFNDKLGLYLVADGMGGAASGEVASKLVAETIAEYVKLYIDQPLESPERYDFFSNALSPRANTLLQAVHLANSLVYDAAHKHDTNKGMGSTLAAILIDGEDALVTNVGDSRVFRSQDGRLERLTVDHRLADDPQFHGVIDPEGTIMTTLGHTLTRGMGVKREVKPDLHRLPLQEGDVFLICSDGLTDMVPEEMIAKVLAMRLSPAKKTKDLIELALAGGGRDNVTAVLAEVQTQSTLKGLLSRLTGGN